MPQDKRTVTFNGDDAWNMFYRRFRPTHDKRTVTFIGSHPELEYYAPMHDKRTVTFHDSNNPWWKHSAGKRTVTFFPEHNIGEGRWNWDKKW